ncbi:NnrU family protein [bacterium]|nr:NnrU family protein [bacterium]
MVKKISFYLYAIIACCLFWAAFAYAVGFFMNIIVPKSIDSGQEGSVIRALLINILLLSTFGIQHSVMARKNFKKWWIKFIPEPIERSTYVLFAGALVWITMIFWQPMTGVVWEIQNTYLKLMIYAVFFMGALISVHSIFVLDHFDYVGLRQVYLHFKKGEYIPLEFKTPTLYKYIRHPMTIGVLIFFWAAPKMTVGHLLFAAGMTIYSFIGFKFEERDLIDLYGEEYKTYKQKVRMFFPVQKRN